MIRTQILLSKIESFLVHLTGLLVLVEMSKFRGNIVESNGHDFI